MGKFSQAGSTGGGLSALERLAFEAQPDLPTGRPEEQVQERPQQPNIQPGTAQDPGVNLQRAEELPSPFQQPLDAQQQFEADLEEQQRHAVPDLKARWNKQAQPKPIMGAVASSWVDGGAIERAGEMAKAVADGTLVPPVSLRKTPGFPLAEQGASNIDVANAIAAENDGSVQAAIARIGAVDQTDPRNPIVDPDFMKAGSLVTENMIMEFAGGADLEADTTVDPIAEAFQEERAKPVIGEKDKIKRIRKQQGNARIGKQIALEYQRLKGNPTPQPIPGKEAETLGDTFKMLWAAKNPDLVKVTRDPKTDQKFIELTPQGEDVLAKGQEARKRLFPTPNVKPAKNPPPKGELRGDAKNQVKDIQGGVDISKKDIDPTIREAMDNLARVPNVVDKQRMKILFSTALPVLQSINEGGIDRWEAEINNIGAKKKAKYQAKHKDEGLAQGEMVKAAQKLANEIQSVAQERNGANYLTYAMQGFQGRISPQQGKFNPTTSKAVRFVTRNAVPSPAKPGSRVDYNLRQMYAMMLVPDADEVLPHVREVKFDAFQDKLEQWGDRLEQALTMSDADAEAIAQAIEAGTPITDPNFPQIAPIALDPEADAELIQKIKDKGEDGPHFIDGAIDAAKYIKARKAGKPYHSYFNAYIDGKTNGIASNGIQMGNSKTARLTGVLRSSTTDYLDAPGDIRAELKNDLMHALDNNGFDGNDYEYSSELTTVARAVFSHRDLNKKTTMTFGYGKEVDTFGQDMYDTAMELKQNPALIKDDSLREAFKAALPEVENRLPDSQEFGKTLMDVYGPALAGVMSKEALATRAIMRSSAVLHAATNTLMSIEGPTKLPLNFGRDAQLPGAADETIYWLRGDKIDKGEKQFAAYHQKSEPTSAAARTYTQTDAEGNVTQTQQAGDFAYGGSVVGPVQALDAATVSKTASGPSWNRMKQASGNNPYLHTIYDAFKADAMGFDVVLEEVNQNWLNTSMDWSYLKETRKATLDTMEKWRSEINKRKPSDPLTENEASYMNFILKQEYTGEGKPIMKNYLKKIGTAGDFKRKGIDAFQGLNEMATRMASVGYDWQDPPAQPTVAHIKMFVDVLNKQLNIYNRMDGAINFTEKNKKELRKEIMAKGYKTRSGRTIALQYYAH